MARRIYTVRRFAVRTGIKPLEFHSFYLHKLFVKNPVLFKLSEKLQILFFDVGKLFFQLGLFLLEFQNIGLVLEDALAQNRTDRQILQELEEKSHIKQSFPIETDGILLIDRKNPGRPTFPRWRPRSK